MRTLLLVTLALAGVAQADHAAPVAPLATYKPPSDTFIDDAFALRADGRALAFITTDGATKASLHLVEVPPGKPEAVIPGMPAHASQVLWLDDARVLIVDRDDKGKLTAQTYSATGPGKEKLGPVDGIALATLDGKPVVVTWLRSEKKGVEHQFTAYARDTWKPVARRAYKENGEGQIVEKSGPWKLLWFRDGFTAAATLKAGEYDKAKDIRRPDRFARIDLFKDKFSDEQEIEDVMAFAQALVDHKKRPDDGAFVHLSDDHKHLVLTDGLSQRDLKLPRELFMYQPEAYQDQRLDADHLLLSATVDPTNPPAVEHKKADPDDIELYRVDVKTATPTRILRVPGEGRGSAWHAAGERLALLRKSKGFERGGVQIDVLELHQSSTASTQRGGDAH
jgi:hypothetical protein